MVKNNRFRIGIIFNFTKGWLGGFYYYQNIIKALNFLEDNEKPEIIIFYNKDYSNYLKEIDYPYLQLVPWQFSSMYKGYVLSFLKRKNIFIDEMIRSYHLKGIYSVSDNPVSAATKLPKGAIAASWYPDLQHKFFPHFFDKKRWWLREQRLKFTLKNATDLVVSSHDTVNHFNQFYKISKKLRVHVLQFVSILDPIDMGKIDQLKSTYQLPDDYFIVSNSFLKHKNHIVVFKAIHALKQANKPIHIVFTGKMEVYADPTHYKMLTDYIKENKLEPNIRLLGVIPRADQLCIMKNAKAVLQPSLFEGWNTSIEDAKSLQLPIIASNIEVHKEQLTDKGYYFNAEDGDDLAKVISSFSNDRKYPLYEAYETRARKFGQDFLKIFKQDR